MSLLNEQNKDDSNMIECPLCQQKFILSEIERHVEKCLTQEKPSLRSKKPQGNVFFQKRTPPAKKRKATSPQTKLVDPKRKKPSDLVKAETLSPFQEELKSWVQNSRTKSSAREAEEASTTLIDCEVTFVEEDIHLYDKKAQLCNKEKIAQTIKLENSSNEVINDCIKLENNDCIQETNATKMQGSRKINNNGNVKKMGKNNTLKQQDDTRVLVLGKCPLADQMRPTSLNCYFGQKAVGTQKLLKDLFNNNVIPSLLLWGPPGCGKTSLAHIISKQCQSAIYRFVTLSATMAGVNDVKEAVKVAKNEKRLTRRKTILFIDEVHRFNKMQQDTFLPHVEDGTIILLGATTENPSFHLNNALMSRCHVVVLEALDNESVETILKQAVTLLGGCEGAQSDSQYRFVMEPGSLKLLAEYANGDARCALNKLDMILQAKLTTDNPFIQLSTLREDVQRCYVNYDRAGDEHYDIISALHKSIRGSNENASIYWLARMLEGGERPLYVARRLVRVASEDVGLADPNALTQAVSAYQACHFLGMPECDVILAQLVTYLARAPKSVQVYRAYNNAKHFVKQQPGFQPPVPLHLRNAPTGLMKKLGYSEGYKYTPDYQGDDAKQDYLPKCMMGHNFFPTT